MNRLILIGNGFDLAHNLKTKYSDFLEDYLKNCISLVKNNNFENEFISITRNNGMFYRSEPAKDMSFTDIYEKLIKKQRSYPYEYTIEIKSTLLRSIFNNLFKNNQTNWVDIETEYYNLLCENVSSKEAISKLNKELETIKQLLKNYLQKVKDEFDFSKFETTNLIDQLLKKTLLKEDNKHPTLILDFNYTQIFENYKSKVHYLIQNQLSLEIINIHGTLENENSMVFGYGDEEDTNFKILEKNDECLKHIKTYWYVRNKKYQEALAFVESDEFEVFIAGHSCGLSDKTLLSEIFNHENCKHIKILTYNKKEDENFNLENSNYIEMSYQIGRLFTNKASLRKKLAYFNENDLLKVTRK